MMAWKDPYAILGVGRDAPFSEIKRAYRKLAFSLHPDVGDDPDETRFREAHEAYQALIQMEQPRPARNQSRAGAGPLWPRGDDARGAARTSRADSAETSGKSNRRLRDRKAVGRGNP